MNFIAVPQTKIDEVDKTILVELDLDEGQSFRVGRIEIVGGDENIQRLVLAKLRLVAGDPFTSQTWETLATSGDCTVIPGWIIDNLEFPQHPDTSTLDIFFHLHPREEIPDSASKSPRVH